MRTRLLALALLLAALPTQPAASAGTTRVIVSNTLNHTLAFFDAASLGETQPPLPVKGTSPVRLWVQRFEGRTFLFSANHGIEGSVGAYDLDGNIVTELPASPFPAGPGAVGVTAGEMNTGGVTVPMVFATNTTFALGGCGMPTGSVTAFDATGIATHGLLRNASTSLLSGPIPYGVGVDPADGAVYASVNCGARVDLLGVGREGISPLERVTMSWLGSIPTGSGPDAVIHDPVHDLLFITNISGSSVTVLRVTDERVSTTTVPMPGARPIDANLADSASGARWLVTSNGGNDSVGLVDRDIAAACATAEKPSCPEAYVLQVPTGVARGEPEGVDYDPGTNRVFAVNKNIGSPSLSVIQLSEADGLRGAPIARIPLGALGTASQVPGIISFDVVVQR